MLSDLSMASMLLAAGAILIGSALQRLSGTGVGLVVTPVLSLLLGPLTGVLMTNATTTVSGFTIMLSVRKRVQWKRAAVVVAAALPGAVLGAYLVLWLPAAWLQIIIGTLVLLALVLTVSTPRLPHVRARTALPVAGVIGGVLNTTAGVAAPAMVIAARLARWEQRAFAASLQPIFMFMGLYSVLAKTIIGAGTVQLPPWWVLPAVVALVLGGVGIGAALETRVPPLKARTLTMLIAGAGGVAAVVKGITTLL
ncbi:sulfite exporter TauE/SafE family protein [Kocuria coralli]|uniref:Probable membrane transporter protein n=1 Tax=Kocuria coralli TaxID=1461025 RepID=A0A5J5L0N3_9MICC|nr:sulfite exporter TauE/SafE family protein [Kocuria coralli]KAA9395519.1 sulfite exporter TauE/SafE family protein [Kocuria coralli]